LITPGQLTSIHLPFGNPGLPGVLAQAIAALALGVGLLRSQRSRPPRIVTAGLVYAASYCGFLLVTGSLFDAVTPLDQRLLVPIVPPLVITIAWLMRSQPLVAATFVSVFVVMVLQQARTVSLYGIDYSGQIWSAARFDRSALPPGPLYSTWPAAVAYFTGRSPRHIPAPYDQDNHAPNRDFQTKLNQLLRAVQRGQASLILLNESFLEIPSTGQELQSLPSLKGECRAITKVVVVCTRRT
jgi:hypothetical protein